MTNRETQAARSTDTARSCVVFIGGWGRSGSTLLECVLAELEQVVVLGEVVHLWERGLRRNELCACGQPFHECHFWDEVGVQAFGGWDNVDPDHLASLKNAVDRQRRIPHTVRRRPKPVIARPVLEYAEYYHRIYEAAKAITGARVVVDSSKEIPTALTLTHHPGIDLRVLHIVRDSRGVAYSWSKTVPRPESPDGDVMHKYSPAASTAFWLAGNLAVKGLTYRGAQVSRLRYEDLIAAPQSTVDRAWEALGLPGSARIPMLDARTVELHRTHSVAGNPMRFRAGRTTLVPDMAWRAGLPVRDRRVVTAMSYPLLRRWGYLPEETRHKP